MKPHYLALLASLLSTADREVRADDGETAILARQLEYIQQELWNIEYAVPIVLELCPLDTTIPPGADTFTYREWDVRGVAEIISNYAKDLPRVDVLVNEYPQKIVDIGDAYGYTVKDLRNAAYAGVQLDPMKAKTAKDAIDRKIDVLLSLGDTGTGLKGFVNNTNVPRVALPTGNWLTGATPDQIIADVTAMVNSVVSTTMDIHHPTTLALPLDHYTYIASTARSPNTDTTILDFILKNSPYLKEIRSWYRLGTSGPSGHAMAMCYQKDPSVVRAVVPLPFEQLPPEIRNLEWLTNCVSRVGGTVWYRPLAAVYGDGL